MIYKPTMKLIKKKCLYEGCKESYIGNLISKYCPEHRKQMYRKIIDKDKIREKKEIKESKESANQRIQHTYKSATVVKGMCQLAGCSEEFDLLILPNVFIYPKFCEGHRSEFKRKRWLEQNGE